MKPIPRLTKQEKEEIFNLLKLDDRDNFLIVKTMIESYLSIYPKELSFKKKIFNIIQNQKYAYYKSNTDLWSTKKFINLK